MLLIWIQKSLMLTGVCHTRQPAKHGSIWYLFRSLQPVLTANRFIAQITPNSSYSRQLNHMDCYKQTTCSHSKTASSYRTLRPVLTANSFISASNAGLCRFLCVVSSTSWPSAARRVRQLANSSLRKYCSWGEEKKKKKKCSSLLCFHWTHLECASACFYIKDL